MGVFVIVGAAGVLFGLLILADAKSAIHEIEAIMCIGFGILTVAIATGFHLAIREMKTMSRRRSTKAEAPKPFGLPRTSNERPREGAAGTKLTAAAPMRREAGGIDQDRGARVGEHYVNPKYARRSYASEE